MSASDTTRDPNEVLLYESDIPAMCERLATLKAEANQRIREIGWLERKIKAAEYLAACAKEDQNG